MMSCDPCDGQIEDGCAIHRNAETEKLFRRQPRHGKGCVLGFFSVPDKELSICGSSRKIARHGRLQALHAAAFLIDQDKKVAPAYRLASLADEAPQLLGVGNIAAKQDQTRGLHLAVEAPFFIGQNSGPKGR